MRNLTATICLTIAVLLGSAGVSYPASARSQADCEASWLRAEKGGIILGVATINGVPTFGVDRATWDASPYNVRSGMMNTFICVMAGPGKSLSVARISDGKGIKFAEWNMGRFEILR